MYCKHCGKEIADDSKFCQHCGGKQLENDREANNDKTPLDNIISKLFSNINKKYLYLYAIWVVLNTILLCFGGERWYAIECFYPFTNYNSFRADYYDSTEYITYVFLIPLLILYYFQYWHEAIKKKFSRKPKKKEEDFDPV